MEKSIHQETQSAQSGEYFDNNSLLRVLRVCGEISEFSFLQSGGAYGVYSKFARAAKTFNYSHV
jgi:hypothetical protein